MKLFLIHKEWADYCILNNKKNILSREKYENELGTYKLLENNMNLEIKWSNWNNVEYFKKKDNYYYSIDFYEKFTAAEFILIYQLDSWVFSDQLNHWCSRGYSYIGAPWFHNFEKGNDSVSLWAAGNGGFSLRKIDDFIEVLESDKKVFPFKFIWSKYEKYGFWEKLLRLPKMLVQYFFRNNTNHLYELFGENEDHFWSFHAKDLEASFTVANVNTALAFAFECNPKRMFELNHKELPFGIHAWEKYDLPFVETVLFSKEVKDN